MLEHLKVYSQGGINLRGYKVEMSKLFAAESLENGEKQAVLRHISSELPEMTHLG